ncbi:LysR family transcriptional regulator [Streptomyces achromogenes]|uniref:LysR family transcriptional regulator n=1 Tax=Streptomyces achromogenes TaxID=67255 RepID=UPI0036ADFBA2
MDELRRIDLDQLLTLHALLVEKHVTRAALRLHKSQPAVSHALAQPRTRFGDPLLVRHGGRTVLTARAQALVRPLGLDLAVGQASREVMAAQLADGEVDPAPGVFPHRPEDIQVQDLFQEEFVSLTDKAVLPRKGACRRRSGWSGRTSCRPCGPTRTTRGRRRSRRAGCAGASP